MLTSLFLSLGQFICHFNWTNRTVFYVEYENNLQRKYIKENFTLRTRQKKKDALKSSHLDERDIKGG
jgi:hypothetical protein